MMGTVKEYDRVKTNEVNVQLFICPLFLESAKSTEHIPPRSCTPLIVGDLNMLFRIVCVKALNRPK